MSKILFPSYINDISKFWLHKVKSAFFNIIKSKMTLSYRENIVVGAQLHTKPYFAKF